MKLVVAKYVYARVGAPSTGVPFSAYRSPGDVITVDNILIGTAIDGSAVWYHCKEDGCFYWSGGFDDPNEELQGITFSLKDEFIIYQSAANELGKSYANIPGYRGIAAGYKVKETTGETQDNLALIVYVDQKNLPGSSMVKDTIVYKGIRLTTDVRSLGIMELQGPDDDIPYSMGGSIASLVIGGDKELELGTRSLLVQKAGVDYLLTCYHVACSFLFDDGTMEFSGEKLQVHLPSKVRFPSAKILLANVVEGSFGTNHDYALIKADTEKLQNNFPERSFNNGYYSLGELKTSFTKQTRFFKYGASTQETQGTFRAYPANDVPLDPNRNLAMSGLLEVTRMSEKGDSGAPVVDENNKFVGIIIGGIDGSSFILPIAQLEFDFHIEPSL